MIQLKQNTHPLNKWNKTFFMILTCSILIRILLFIEFPHVIIHTDSRLYIEDAHYLSQTFNKDHDKRTLAYPALIAVVSALTGNFIYLIIIQIFMALFLSILFYNIFLKVCSKNKLALWLFGLLSLGTLSINYEWTVMPEILFSFFLGLTFWQIILLKDKYHWKYLVGIGIFAGLATITKPAGLYFLVFGVFFIYFINHYYKLSKKYLLINIVIFYFFFLIPVSGNMIYNNYQRGFTGLTLFGGIQLYGATAEFTDFESDKNKEIKKLIALKIKFYKKNKNKLSIDWIFNNYEGSPSSDMLKFAGSRKDYNAICMDLAIEGILKHPFDFTFKVANNYFKNMFLSLETTNHFHRDHETVIITSWGRLDYIQKSLGKKIIELNSSHPKTNKKEHHKSFVNPLFSMGSAVRFLLVISPTRIIPIWSIGLFFSLYILFIKRKIFTWDSPIILLYLMIFFHIGIHAVMTTPSSRNIFPILNHIIFLFLLSLGYLKKKSI